MNTIKTLILDLGYRVYKYSCNNKGVYWVTLVQNGYPDCDIYTRDGYIQGAILQLHRDRTSDRKFEDYQYELEFNPR